MRTFSAGLHSFKSNIEKYREYSLEAIIEIRLRKPSKTASWPPNEELSKAWAREILGKIEHYPHFDEYSLKRALQNYEGDYAPDIGDLLKIIIKESEVTFEDIKKSYRDTKVNLLDYSARPELSRLSRLELYCLREYPGGINCFKADTTEVGIKNWGELMKAGRQIPINELPEAIEVNFEALQHSRDYDVGRKHIQNIKSLLKMN